MRKKLNSYKGIKFSFNNYKERKRELRKTISKDIITCVWMRNKLLLSAVLLLLLQFVHICTSNFF